MKHVLVLIAVISILFFGYGCESKPVHHDPSAVKPSTCATTKCQQDPGLRQGQISEEELARQSRDRERERQAMEAARAALFADILFEFDSYTIKETYIPILAQMGDWLKKNRSANVTIEGHTDERGTTEYNLVLGQKRSEAVRDVLTKAGVEARRLKTISYGKEMPLDAGHNEQAWVKNRRVHFVLDEKR